MTDNVSMLPLLVVQTGLMRGASFRMRGETCVIGRDEGVDVRFEDHEVSHRHAVIERVGDRLMLADAGSINGTWLNERRLTEAAELSDRDRIRLGAVELRFYDPATAATDRVGAAIRAVSPGRARAGSPEGRAAAPGGALFGPTQVTDTGRPESGNVRLILATLILVLLGVAVWAVLIR